MKQVSAEWRIDDMPDGEAALAKIERLGRIAYKSEGLIDPGEKCKGDYNINQVCRACDGSGWLRHPSSHKFVRMILKAERQAKMVILAREYMESFVEGPVDVRDMPPEAWEKLVGNIVQYMDENPAHESVIEHVSATVVFTSNRGFTHEIVRHRLASFTQESTRYCDYNKGKFGGEITVIEQPYYTSPEADVMALSIWQEAMKHAEYYYKELRRVGVPPQIARGVLPHDTKADIAVTANFREWRHVFHMRDSKAAHPDMQYLVTPLHHEFQRRVPIVFDEV